MDETSQECGSDIVLTELECNSKEPFRNFLDQRHCKYDISELHRLVRKHGASVVCNSQSSSESRTKIQQCFSEGKDKYSPSKRLRKDASSIAQKRSRLKTWLSSNRHAEGLSSQACRGSASSSGLAAATSSDYSVHGNAAFDADSGGTPQQAPGISPASPVSVTSGELRCQPFSPQSLLLVHEQAPQGGVLPSWGGARLPVPVNANSNADAYRVQDNEAFLPQGSAGLDDTADSWAADSWPPRGADPGRCASARPSAADGLEAAPAGSAGGVSQEPAGTSYVTAAEIAPSSSGPSFVGGSNSEGSCGAGQGQQPPATGAGTPSLAARPSHALPAPSALPGFLSHEALQGLVTPAAAEIPPSTGAVCDPITWTAKARIEDMLLEAQRSSPTPAGPARICSVPAGLGDPRALTSAPGSGRISVCCELARDRCPDSTPEAAPAGTRGSALLPLRPGADPPSAWAEEEAWQSRVAELLSRRRERASARAVLLRWRINVMDRQSLRAGRFERSVRHMLKLRNGVLLKGYLMASAWLRWAAARRERRAALAVAALAGRRAAARRDGGPAWEGFLRLRILRRWREAAQEALRARAAAVSKEQRFILRMVLRSWRGKARSSAGSEPGTAASAAGSHGGAELQREALHRARRLRLRGALRHWSSTAAALRSFRARAVSLFSAQCKRLVSRALVAWRRSLKRADATAGEALQVYRRTLLSKALYAFSCGHQRRGPSPRSPSSRFALLGLHSPGPSGGCCGAPGSQSTEGARTDAAAPGSSRSENQAAGRRPKEREAQGRPCWRTADGAGCGAWVYPAVRPTIRLRPPRERGAFPGTERPQLLRAAAGRCCRETSPGPGAADPAGGSGEGERPPAAGGGGAPAGSDSDSAAGEGPATLRRDLAVLEREANARIQLQNSRLVRLRRLVGALAEGHWRSLQRKLLASAFSAWRRLASLGVFSVIPYLADDANFAAPLRKPVTRLRATLAPPPEPIGRPSLATSRGAELCSHSCRGPNVPQPGHRTALSKITETGAVDLTLSDGIARDGSLDEASRSNCLDELSFSFHGRRADQHSKGAKRTDNAVAAVGEDNASPEGRQDLAGVDLQQPHTRTSHKCSYGNIGVAPSQVRHIEVAECRRQRARKPQTTVTRPAVAARTAPKRASQTRRKQAARENLPPGGAVQWRISPESPAGFW